MSERATTSPADEHISRKQLVVAILAYTALRLAMVAVIAGLIVGLSLLVDFPVPLFFSLLVAIIITMPLSMVVGKSLRDRITRGIAQWDADRQSYRDELERRMSAESAETKRS